MGVLRVIGGVLVVLVAANGVGHLLRQRVDRHVNVQGAQRGHDLVVERGDRAWEQAQRFTRTVTGLDEQVVLDEVEAHREGAHTVGDG